MCCWRDAQGRSVEVATGVTPDAHVERAAGAVVPGMPNPAFACVPAWLAGLTEVRGVASDDGSRRRSVIRSRLSLAHADAYRFALWLSPDTPSVDRDAARYVEMLARGLYQRVRNPLRVSRSGW